MPDPALALLLLSAFLAEVVGTIAGFGAATILTPVAVLFMDVKTAIAVVACFHLFGNASRLLWFRGAVQWPVWWQFGLTGVAASLLGALVAGWLSSDAVKLCLGAFLLTYVGWSVAPVRALQLPRHPGTLIGGGVLSGFVAGLIGTGGAIRAACLLVFGLPPHVYIATSAAIALVVDATRLPVYLRQGVLPASFGPILAALLLVAFAGSWLGRRLIHRLPPAVFRRAVLTMLALIGGKLLLEGWHGLG